jgi:hypothetical protein
MWYYRAKIWFGIQVLLYNCCFTLPVTMVGNALFILVFFLTIGYLCGLVTVSIFHKQERFVMLNLGISKLSLIAAGWLVQVVFLITLAINVISISVFLDVWN